MSQSPTGHLRLSTAGLLLSLIVSLTPTANAYLRYTEQSCIDLTPRTYDDYTHAASYTSAGPSSRKRRANDYGEAHEIPFRMSAKGKRYRRDADVVRKLQ